MKMATYRCRGC